MTTAWPVEDVVETDAILSARARADAANPVFGGHYPGFAILPGLYLVEYVNATVRARRGSIRAVALDKIKFLRPVYPGDELSIRAELSESDGGLLACSATVRVGGEPVAEVVLHYAPGGGS